MKIIKLFIEFDMLLCDILDKFKKWFNHGLDFFPFDLLFCIIIYPMGLYQMINKNLLQMKYGKSLIIHVDEGLTPYILIQL